MPHITQTYASILSKVMLHVFRKANSVQWPQKLPLFTSHQSFQLKQAKLFFCQSLTLPDKHWQMIYNYVRQMCVGKWSDGRKKKLPLFFCKSSVLWGLSVFCKSGWFWKYIKCTTFYINKTKYEYLCFAFQSGFAITFPFQLNSFCCSRKRASNCVLCVWH